MTPMKTSDRFGRWTVLDVPSPVSARSKIPCQCDCGRKKDVIVDNLRRGLSTSCGCLRDELRCEPQRVAMERFMEKVDRGTQSDCWIWMGTRNDNGYGRFYDQGRVWPAHRWIIEQTGGSLGDELEPDHLCRNRSCVNPAHLEPVTHRVNSQRAAYAATECSNGHVLPAPAANGRRVCRECANERNRRYKERKKAAA